MTRRVVAGGGGQRGCERKLLIAVAASVNGPSKPGFADASRTRRRWAVPISPPPSSPHRPEAVLRVVGVVADSSSCRRRKGCNTENEVLAASSCLKRRRVTPEPGRPGLWGALLPRLWIRGLLPELLGSRTQPRPGLPPLSLRGVCSSLPCEQPRDHPPARGRSRKAHGTRTWSYS